MLEVALFTRHKKRVALTTTGQGFARYVSNAMEQLQEGQQFLTEMQAGQRGTIRIGCIESLATAFLPDTAISDWHFLVSQVLPAHSYNCQDDENQRVESDA
jgi:DNA-binding transcriptional LysR family regulator